MIEWHSLYWKCKNIREKRNIDEGKQKFSKEIYTIDKKKEGFKLFVKDEKRNLEPSELLKADKVSNPISQPYIINKNKSKENSKKTN